MTGESGLGTEEEPDLKWIDIEEVYTRAYQKGEQVDEFLDREGDSEALRLYLRYKPYNLMIGRPLYPERFPGICFWIQVTAPPERGDIKRELYAALEDDERLFFLHEDVLENAGRPRTEEIMKMIKQGHLIPKQEFLEETG
jgi:hypothetical protein